MPNSLVCLSIAIVEDDVILREELGHFLRSQGHTVHETVSGPGLDDLMAETQVDIVILDLNLPGQSGFEIAKRLREDLPDLGLIILSARTGSVDRIGSYEHGADIYIPKPCPPHELLAAVRSLGRRVKVSDKSSSWQIDPVRQVLMNVDGSIKLQLQAVEAHILAALARSHQRQMSADELCELIGQKRDVVAVSRRALENKISRLRKKFEALRSDEQALIRSVRGEGYQLCLPVSIAPAATDDERTKTDSRLQ
jgi:DNA-binding response OmpR family regulator